MNKQNRILSLIVAGAILLTTQMSNVSAKRGGDSPAKTVAEGNTEFALDLYDQLKGKEGNLFFSPYSISTALAMTYAGARGETEKQMAEALHFSLSQEALHPAFSSLQAGLNEVQKKGHVKLAIANSLWPHKKYPFKKDFMELVENNYGTSITSLDYAKETEKARQTINKWVEDKTNNKIKDLIKPGILNALTRMVLANAIYFKGNWASQFKKKFTRDMPFRINPSKKIKAPMMFQKHEFGYYTDNQIQVLEMPYVGEQLSMVVLLPKKVDGLAQIEKSLSAAKLKQWTGKLRKTEVETWFPKFKMTLAFSLAEKLIALGMINAFDMGRADFSGMDGTKMLFISAVIHKAFVEVNEEGTEAAAATAVMMMKVSARMYPQFRADHPFIFLIRDKATDSILFMGRVVDPTDEGEGI